MRPTTPGRAWREREPHAPREAAADRAQDDERKVRVADLALGELGDERHADGGPAEPGPHGEHPRAQGPAPLGPPRGEVPEQDLERKVDQDGEREVLLAEPFLEQLERGGRVRGGRAELGDEVHEDELLDVCEWVSRGGGVAGGE